MSLISEVPVPADRGRGISKFLSRIAIAALAIPLAFPALAEEVNKTLPPRVAQALKVNKIESSALSVVMLPLNSNASPTFVNADVSVNPASTMKLVTTYAALELLGPDHQWKTEFHADGPIENGTLNGNLYLKVAVIPSSTWKSFGCCYVTCAPTASRP